MKNLGEELNEIVKNILKIKELDEKIKKMEKKLLRKWSSYGE